jgi:NTP pyrophosphatase (non-canonical NTP hydrolase)
MSDVTLDNYLENAVRTESIVDDLNEGRWNSRVIHGLFGLVTETGELYDAYKRHVFYVKEDGKRKPLDIVNIQEEVGDLMWYMAILCDYYGQDFKRSVEIYRKPCDAATEVTFLRALSNFHSAVSKMENEYLCLEINPNLGELFNSLAHFVSFIGSSWEEIAQVNINKLRARFPEKYETSKAYDRDLNKERQILEDGHNN